MQSYTWSIFGGNLTSTNGLTYIDVIWNSTLNGSYIQVSYLGTNCILATKSDVIVTRTETPVMNGGVTEICQTRVGENLVSYETSPNKTNYYWTVSSGGVISGASNLYKISVYWVIPGTQSISVSYSSQCQSYVTSKNVLVKTRPNPTILGDAIVCGNTGGHIYTTEAGMSNYYWTIFNGSAPLGYNSDLLNVSWANGEGDLQVSVTNSEGCGGVSSKKNISAKYVNGHSSIGPDQFICGDTDPVEIKDTWFPYYNYNGPLSYQWKHSRNYYDDYIDIPGAINSSYDPPIGASGYFKKLTYTIVNGNICPSKDLSWPAQIYKKNESPVSFDFLPPKPYGSNAFFVTATTSFGLPISYTSSNPSVASVSGNIVTITGAGTTTITASQAGNLIYCQSSKSQLLTVNKAMLTATANNVFKNYGATNPPLTISYSGFVNGENSGVIDSQPSVSSAPTTITNVGYYPIIPSGGSDNNYQFSFANGTLTINKATLTATANNASKEYLSPNPPFSISYSGFLNGENSSVIDSQPSVTSSAGTNSAPGTYPLTPSGGSDNNYTFGYVSGVLTIAAAPTTCWVSITTSGDLCTQGRVRLTASVSGGIVSSYSWSTNETANRIFVYWNDYYSVTVNFTNGCTATQTIYIAPVSGWNCIYYLKAAEPQPAPIILNTSIFPNPADSELSIELPDEFISQFTENIPVTMIDQLGKIAFNSSFEKGQKRIRIDTKELTNGLYFLQLGNKNSGLLRQKIMIVHKN